MLTIERFGFLYRQTDQMLLFQNVLLLPSTAIFITDLRSLYFVVYTLVPTSVTVTKTIAINNLRHFL